MQNVNDLKLQEALHLLNETFNMLRRYRDLGEVGTLDEFNEEVGLEHLMLIVQEFLLECDKEEGPLRENRTKGRNNGA